MFGLFLSDRVLEEDRGLPEPVGHRHQGDGSDLPAGAGERRLAAPEGGTCSEGGETNILTQKVSGIYAECLSFNHLY